MEVDSKVTRNAVLQWYIKQLTPCSHVLVSCETPIQWEQFCLFSLQIHAHLVLYTVCS